MNKILLIGAGLLGLAILSRRSSSSGVTSGVIMDGINQGASNVGEIPSGVAFTGASSTAVEILAARDIIAATPPQTPAYYSPVTIPTTPGSDTLSTYASMFGARISPAGQDPARIGPCTTERIGPGVLLSRCANGLFVSSSV